jgi:hypothetical protein
MVARLGAMLRDCGRTREAQEFFALAEALCAHHLALDHPLARQVRRLANGRPDPAHRGRAPGDVANLPDQRTITATPAPRVPGEHSTASRHGPLDVAAPDVNHEPLHAAREPDGRTTPESSADAREQHAPAAPPGQPPPADAREQHAPAAPPAPPAPASAREQRAPATGEEPRPPTAPPAAGTAVGPPVGPAFGAADVGGAGREGSGEGDGEQRQVTGSAAGVAADPVRAVPVGSDVDERRLPVPVPVLPPAEPSRRRVVAVLTILVLAAVSVAAAGIVALLRPRGLPPPAEPAETGPAVVQPELGQASGGPGATPTGPAPVTGVTLHDSGSSVRLTWTYPHGAAGPVVVSGARSGEAVKAFQQLPAGSNDYVVYGLDERVDYCFTVSVVYGTDTVASSPQKCTARPH